MNVLTWLFCTLTLVGSGIVIGQAIPPSGEARFKLGAALLLGLGLAITAAQQLAPISEFNKSAMAALGFGLVLASVVYRFAKAHRQR